MFIFKHWHDWTAAGDFGKIKKINLQFNCNFDNNNTK